jgi:putative CocE/NonD family hydrolase
MPQPSSFSIIFKRLCVTAILIKLGCLLYGCTEIASKLLDNKVAFRPTEYDVKIERGVAFQTSEGITLVSDIYHPQKTGHTATILVRIPYSKTFTNRLFASAIGESWAARGYTVIVQGTRGRYQSSGKYYPLRHERKDGTETLQWIAKKPWFNGYLGMWGGSYFGYTQWALADQTDPGPSALIIQLSSTDFYGMFYPGGAFSLESALYWAAKSHGEQDVEPSQEDLKKGYEGFPLIETDNRAVGSIPFFKDWVKHSTRDVYWEEIDGQDRSVNLQAPALLMAGWYDPFLPTQINDFIRIQNEAKPNIAKASRLIIGPWAHAETVTFPDGFKPKNYRLESLAPSIPWFDLYLHSSPVTPQETAAVRIYVMGKNVWREEKEWPLARTKYIPYYLQSGGKANSLMGDGVLSQNMPTTKEALDTFIYDPMNPVPTAGGAMIGPRAGIMLQNANELRPDVLVYTTPPLGEDLEVTGPIRIVLYVSTTAPNTDFTGKLVDVYADGSAYNVSEGILRRQFPHPNGISGSDKATAIEIELWPTSTVFLKGHRIRLEISSSNFPRYDRNPNTGQTIATETRIIRANQIIYHTPEAPSHVLLPVIPQ